MPHWPGYRPVVELYMAEFMLVAMDQVVNEGNRFRAMTGGQVKVPIVLKAGYGFTAGWSGQHTGTISALFMGVPGLKVVVPSTAADAKGLMATAIRDDNPVVYLHNYLLTLEHGEVPDGEHLVPFGEAAIRREGSDVTIVGTGWTVDRAARRSRDPRRRGHLGRGDRPPHAEPARHAHDPRIGREDRAARARRSGDAARVRRDRDRGRGGRARVLVPQGPDRAGDGDGRDRALQRAARGVGDAERREGRRRSAAGGRLPP